MVLFLEMSVWIIGCVYSKENWQEEKMLMEPVILRN